MTLNDAQECVLPSLAVQHTFTQNAPASSGGTFIDTIPGKLHVYTSKQSAAPPLHKLMKQKVNYTRRNNNGTSLFNASFDAKYHSTYRVVNAIAQPFFVGEIFEKHKQLEYDETQIIDVQTGNELFFDSYTGTRWLKFKLRKHQKRHKTIQ